MILRPAKIFLTGILTLILFSCSSSDKDGDNSVYKPEENKQNAAQSYISTQKRHIQTATDAVEKSKAAQEETKKAIEGIQ